MDGDDRGRFRSFLIGGAVGAATAVATARRRREVGKRRAARRDSPAGLAAFEGAPCYREIVEQELVTEDETPATPG